ncbi:MAG: FGGY family carbohydrate kinase [Clostridiales bacterium]|nr:FGGY family carbohydrate kinase [Clostridiales bacterium]
MELLLGLDIGSTSVKSIIYTKFGEPVSQASIRLPLTHSHPDRPSWCVWRHEDVWAIAKSVIAESVGKLNPGDSVKALAVTGFGMDGLPIDRDGKELSDLISWHCPRTLEQYEEYREYFGREDIVRETLRRSATMIDSVYRIKWMEKHEPAIMEKADKWLLIEDYVNFKLCGAVATDYSMASTTSLIRQDLPGWSDRIVGDLGVRKSLLPPAMLSGTALGKVRPEVASETGLSTDTEVVLGGHDYIVAAFAAGVRPGEILDITGTWEMLVGVTQDAAQISLDDLFYVEPHVTKGAWCPIESAISGDMMGWMVEYQGGNWDDVMKAAEESQTGSRGCTFLPHFSGSYAPNIEPTSLGAFVGMSNAVTRGDTSRAVLEGLNYKTREMYEAMKRTMASDIKVIKADGGATKTPLWMQIKADILGVPIHIVNLYEATSLGAAMLAGLGTGVYESEEDAISSVTKPSAVYEPSVEAHARYSDIYENVYLKLQGSLSDVNKGIYDRFIK